MGWDVRFCIVVGIIKGFKFIYFECNLSILYYNFKFSNVLLDVEFELKFVDCGFVKFMFKLYRLLNGYRVFEIFYNCR